MSSLIELARVSVNLSFQTILHEVSLKIEAGQRVVVMGPSGSGKSTLLRVAAGLQAVNHGHVLLNDQPASTVAASQRNIALLTQDYALYPQLTVGQNLQAALQQQRLAKSEIANRCEQVAHWFEIEELLERLPSQISGGQAQRVALAKALARQPRLLLLDEPFSQLDTSLRNQMTQTILNASRELGIALLWVTHEPREAFRISDRIVVLDAGRVIQDASPDSIYRTPQTPLVADVTSLWPVNWVRLENLKGADSKLSEYGSPHLLDRAPTGSILAGLRAEDLLASECAKAGWIKLTIAVKNVEDLGFDKLIHGNLFEDTPVQLLAGRHEIGSQNQLQVCIDPAHVLWF